MNSYTKTIIGPTCKDLLENTSITMIDVSVAKDPDSKNKEFFSLYQFLVKNS